MQLLTNDPINSLKVSLITVTVLTLEEKVNGNMLQYIT